jgi:hypothetical protein
MNGPFQKNSCDVKSSTLHNSYGVKNVLCELESV